MTPDLLLQALLLTTLLHSTSVFDIRCPEDTHRGLRASGFCKNIKNVSKYSCLLDINFKTYKETCTQPKNFVPAGEKYIISGLRTSTDCAKERYQPFKFWSDAQSRCIYRKSFCNEVGQVTYSLGSTTEDSTCGCDYKKGYRFVLPPKDSCYCTPSQEDCSCFLDQCPGNTCFGNLTAHSYCKEHVSILHVVNSTDQYRIIKEDLKTGFSRPEGSRNTFVIPLIILVPGSTILCIAVCKRTSLLPITNRTLAVINDCLRVNRTITKIDLKPTDHFVKRIIGCWSNVKTSLCSPNLIEELLKMHYIRTKDFAELTKMSQNMICLFILQILKDNCTNADNTHDLESLLLKHCPHMRDILSEPVSKPRWPKRDEDKCKEILNSCVTIRKNIEPIYCVDDFFQSFIFDIDDYKSILKNEANREERATSFLNTIEEKICKGSFECLLTVLNRNVHPAEIFTEIQPKLVKAVYFQLKNTQETITAAQMHWKCLGFDIKSGDKNESLLDMVLIERIKQCSKWFVEEVAMYPEVNEKSEIVLIPLTEDAFERLENSIRNRGFSNLLDLIFYKQQTINTLLGWNQNTLHVILREHHFGQEIKLDTLDHRLILRVTRKFLEQNIEPNIITEEFRRNGIILERSTMTQAEIVNVLENNNSTVWCTFLRILEEKSMTYILEQLKPCEPVLLRNNILQNMSELAEIDIIDHLCVFYNENNISTDIGFVSSLHDTISDNEEQMMAFIVKTLQAGSMAMFAFVHFLFNSNYETIAKTLFSNSVPMKMKEYADKMSQFDKKLNVVSQEYDVLFENIGG